MDSPTEDVYEAQLNRIRSGESELCRRADMIAAGPTGIEKQVCEDIARRQALGIAKYGTTVADNPLSLKQWLQHAFEEALDQAIYLKRAIAELEK